MEAPLSSENIHHSPGQIRSVRLICDTVSRFLASLGPDQRGRAVLQFETDERFMWDYRPREDRRGLPLKNMDSSNGSSLSLFSHPGSAREPPPHAVWRDVSGDRGDDLPREHCGRSHGE
jgi:hypothetical protein